MNRLICPDQTLDMNLQAELVLLGFENAMISCLEKPEGSGQLCIEQGVYACCVFDGIAHFLSLGPILVMLEISETFSS